MGLLWPQLIGMRTSVNNGPPMAPEEYLVYLIRSNATFGVVAPGIQTALAKLQTQPGRGKWLRTSHQADKYTLGGAVYRGLAAIVEINDPGG